MAIVTNSTDKHKSPNTSPASEPKGKWRERIEHITGPWTWANLRGWLLIILLVLVVRWAFIEPFKIPSGSMEPTLHGDPRFMRGDRVFVNKLHYGLRVPFANSRFFEWRDPKRFELVVFRAVQEDAEHDILVKRIIGLPGEEVHIADGEVHIDGEPLQLPEDMPDVHYTRAFQVSDADRQEIVEMFGPEQAERIVQESVRRGRRQRPFRYGILESEQHSVVPEDHYFMLGDNSGNSVDSRHYGWVPRDHILGRVFCIWWPIDHWRDFTGFSQTWWGRLLLYGPPAALGLYMAGALFLFNSWAIEASSRLCGVKQGDRIVVSKASYGLRLPLVRNPVTKGRAPVRGEAVAFFETDGETLGIGRIAALPGEKTGVKNGSIQIGGERLEDLVPSLQELGPVAVDGKSKQTVLKEGQYAVMTEVVGDEDEEPKLALRYVERADLAGPLTAVWWPLRRVGRVCRT